MLNLIRGNKNTGILVFLALVAWIIKNVVSFVKLAIQKGRAIELLISSPVLILTYYFMILNYRVLPLWVFLIPLGVFSLYWVWLFSQEKITSELANINWANRDWWWSLDGWEFEEEVAKIFRLNGYKVEVTRKTGDGGVDLIMYKDNEKVIVQCKHYSNPVAPEVLRALWGVREDFGTNKVLLVASSGISDSSSEFIKNKPTFGVMNLEDVIRIGLRPSSRTL